MILILKFSKTLLLGSSLCRLSTMNFLKRAITTQLSHSSHPSRKCLFLLHPITQSSLYSTSYKLKDPQITKNPRTQKPQDPLSPPSSSSMTWSQRVKKQAEQLADSSGPSIDFADLRRTGDNKQAEALTNWPRPSEIPYQAKVANLVNLIGHIKTPVKFQSTPSGKYLSGAIISQENDQDQSFFIPVVFEGDLAHVVASHVKINDCVYVNGRLSEDPLPFVLSENQGNFHVAVENINFVQGFVKKAFEYKSKENIMSMAGGGNIFSKGVVGEPGVETANSDRSTSQTSFKSGDTIKEGDTLFDSWRDVVKNPRQWWDYREQKFKGLVKEKHPDFKHKDNGTALWLNTAPKWVLPGLERLDFDVPVPKEKGVKVSKVEDSWKSLVENPDKWWDNRLNKKNEKFPDFKHKETGDVLWLNRLPDWVLSKLPPLKEKQNVAAGKNNM